MTTYSIVLFQSIGVADEYKMLIYLYFLDMMADGFAFILADKIGRRPLMFTSSVLVAGSLFTVGGLTGYAGKKMKSGMPSRGDMSRQD